MTEPSSDKPDGWSRVSWLLLLLLAAILVIGLGSLLPVREWFEALWEAVDRAGPLGYLLFILIGTLATLVFVPVSPVILSAGVLFGFWSGLGLSLIVLTASMFVSYHGGRLTWNRLSGIGIFRNPVFRAIRRAVQEEGIWLIALLRMTPFVHFTTGNLFFGSLSLPLLPYLGASCLGMLPGTALLVSGGTVAGRTLQTQAPPSSAQVVLLVAGVLCFMGIAFHLTKRTRSIIKQTRE